MQDLIVYIIIFGAIVYTIVSIVRKVLSISKSSTSKNSPCSGCSGCSLSNNEASCNSIIKQIKKFE